MKARLVAAAGNTDEGRGAAIMFRLTSGVILVALTVGIHSMVLSWCISRLRLERGISSGGFFANTWLLSRLAVWAVFAHLLEIALWASFYVWRGVMPEMETALYFSGVTYATIGYGDIVPPPDWRLLAAMEGLTGILMCAWSGGFILAVVSRMHFPEKSRRPGS
jgi:hypothetical protein